MGDIELCVTNSSAGIIAEVKIPRKTKGHIVMPDKIKKFCINGKEKYVQNEKQTVVLKEGIWKIKL